MTLALLNLPGEGLVAFELSAGAPGNFNFKRIMFGMAVFEIRANLNGGKGGFGSLLRSQKHWAKQTTNFQSSRDLSGRRLRRSQAAERLSEWVEQQRRDDAVVAELLPETDRTVPRSALPESFVEDLKKAGNDKKRLIAEVLSEEPAAVIPVATGKFKRTKLDLEISSSED